MNYLFKALDDPTRREMIDLLKEGDLTAGEIAEKFDISKPSISYHLDLLKRADLVISQKKGQYVYYTLNTSVVDDIINWLLSVKASAPQVEKGGAAADDILPTND